MTILLWVLGILVGLFALLWLPALIQFLLGRGPDNVPDPTLLSWPPEVTKAMAERGELE